MPLPLRTLPRRNRESVSSVEPVLGTVRHGPRSLLVNAGGDLLHLGNPGTVVGIENPLRPIGCLIVDSDGRAVSNDEWDAHVVAGST